MNYTRRQYEIILDVDIKMPPGREYMYSSETLAKVKKRPGVTEDPLAPKQHVKAAKQAAGVKMEIPKPVSYTHLTLPTNSSV